MKAVFFDKDGTLIDDIPYNVNPSLVRMKPFALECLSRMNQLNYMIILITNQSGVARGIFKESDLNFIKTRLEEIMAKFHIPLSGFYYCPHHPNGVVEEYTMECECRKPSPGLIKRAARDLNISLSESWMVGDKLDDINAGKSAGCRTILLNERKDFISRNEVMDFTAENLHEAAGIIEKNSRDLNITMLQ